MNKPNLKAVGNADFSLDEDFAEKVAEEMKAPRRNDVGTMITDTGKSIAEIIAGYRIQEKLREDDKRAAAERYRLAVEMAAAERDRVNSVADAELHQIRETIAALEPARARLAESA